LSKFLSLSQMSDEQRNYESDLIQLGCPSVIELAAPNGTDCNVYEVGGDKLGLAREAFAEQVIDVGADGFMREASDVGFQADVINHAFGVSAEPLDGEIFRDKKLYLFTSQGQIHGFASISTFGLDRKPQLNVMHVEGLVLDANLRGNGVGSEFITSIVGHVDPPCDVIAYHTANKAMRDTGGKVGVLNNPLAYDLAYHIGTAAEYMLSVETPQGEVLLHAGRYGEGGLYGCPLREYLIDDLDEERGDAQICVFLLKPHTVVN
jgi:hypothetical protein